MTVSETRGNQNLHAILCYRFATSPLLLLINFLLSLSCLCCLTSPNMFELVDKNENKQKEAGHRSFAKII